MNVTEAVHVQTITAHVAGESVDRDRLAASLAWVEERSHLALGAGTTRDAAEWWVYLSATGQGRE